MFEWHFTIRGAEGTDFEGGIYHGRILLPPEYPFKPPHIMFLTPSGRFETNTKVCLSFSAYHPELWQPAWGIRLILEALISFLPTPADGAIGALDWSSTERKRLAAKSTSWQCALCGNCKDLLPKTKAKDGSKIHFSKEIEELQRLQKVTEGNKTTKKEENVSRDREDEDTNNEGMEVAKEEEKKQEIVDESTRTTTITTNEEHEADKLQNDSAPATSLQDDVITEDVPTLLTEAESLNPSSKIDAQLETQVTAGVQEEEVEVAAVNEFADSDPSWMYDPLLNLMILLLSVICYLLFDKFVSLREELALLQEENN